MSYMKVETNKKCKQTLESAQYRLKSSLTFTVKSAIYYATIEMVFAMHVKIHVKSAYEPSGSSGRSLSRFPWHEATRNISTPP